MVLFVGEIKGKKRHGFGTYTWADDGCYYTGQWVNDQQNGKGTMTFKNGTRFEGDFFKNNIHGNGVLTTAIGERISGQFKFVRRFITTDGPRFPVSEYILNVEVIARTGEIVNYRGPATLHLFTGLLVLPHMVNPNAQTSVYQSVLVLEPVNEKEEESGVAVVEAEPLTLEESKVLSNAAVNPSAPPPAKTDGVPTAAGTPVATATAVTMNESVKYGEYDQSYNKELKYQKKRVNPFLHMF